MKLYKNKFKIYCAVNLEKTKQFYWIYIFDDKDKMYKFVDKNINEEDKKEHNYYGLCHSYELYYIDKDKKEYLQDEIGFICLIRNNLGVGTISHECTHATIYYLNKYGKYYKNGLIDDKADEEFAWLQGFLVGQLIYKLYKYKVY